MQKNKFPSLQRPIIRIKNGPPDCPLCGKKMREVWYGKHRFFVCTEAFCMISVNANDPCIDQWEKLNSAAHAPKCQLCGEPMKVFIRKDRLVIMQCRNKVHRMYQVARGDARALPPLEDTHGPQSRRS